MSEVTGAVTSAPAAESGPRTDRLELLQQYGGTTGAVHKARNPKLNRVVALRQVQVPEWLDNAEDLIKQILAEARAAGALDHPNIARLYTAGYKGFTVFLTSEFVEGQNIKEFVYTRNLGLPQIIALGKQLCAALDYAHQKKILHHALTPANLKVLPDGTLKVLDFGLLRDKQLYSPTPAKRLESEHYLSPEQLRNRPVDARTNVFSAATVLYELFTTRNPFGGKHLGEVDRNITDVDPAPASLAHPRVSDAISKVLLKALSKNPLVRFQTAAEFATALEEAVNPAPARTVAAAVPAPVPAPKQAAPAAVSSSAKVAAPNPAQPAPVTAAAQPAANAPKPAATQPSKPATTVMRRQPARPAGKMPAKILTQWKLVGAVVAIVFVLSAMAISFNHRSKVSPKTTAAAPPSGQAPLPAPPPAAELPSLPSLPVQASPGVTTAEPEPTIEVIQPRTAKQRIVKSAAPARAVAAKGQLVIASEPDGVTIVLDGRAGQSWKTPQVLDSLSPGVYKVSFSKAGYASETRSVEVLSGNRTSLDVRLTALRATLTIAGTPSGVRILIDGRDTGKTSPSEFSLDPGVHNVTLRKEGYFDSATDIKLSAGQAVSYSPTLKVAGRTDNIKVVGGSFNVGGFKKIFGGHGGSSEGMSRMEIRTDPKGAQVTINGTPLEKTTPLEIQLEPGNYEITLQKNGYKPVHKSISAQANDRLKIDEPLVR